MGFFFVELEDGIYAVYLQLSLDITRL